MLYVWESDIYSQKTDEKIDGIVLIPKENSELEIDMDLEIE